MKYETKAEEYRPVPGYVDRFKVFYDCPNCYATSHTTISRVPLVGMTHQATCPDCGEDFDIEVVDRFSNPLDEMDWNAGVIPFKGGKAC